MHSIAQIGQVLDDADEADVALRIAADGAGIRGVEVGADGAGADIAKSRQSASNDQSAAQS